MACRSVNVTKYLCYSCLNAADGSMRDARYAGRKVAKSAAMNKTSSMQPKVIVKSGVIAADTVMRRPNAYIPSRQDRSFVCIRNLVLSRTVSEPIQNNG
jgi:hypothetical protein